MEKQTIAKVIVGSRLHGTATETSDWDYRGIHISPLRDVISPFKQLKTTSWIEGNIDDVSYELTDFVKQATVGNATALEVFFSDKIVESTNTHKEMQDHWDAFMNSERFLSASRGYAQNQYRKMLDYSDTGVKNQPRTAKFIISFIRVMWQCEQFFLTGDFKCSLDKCEFLDYIMSIKGKTKVELQESLPVALGIMNELENRVTLAHSNSEFKDMKPDYEYIEDFLLRAYKGEIK